VKLGLATKCVYNRWALNVYAITRRQSAREEFINDVIETYKIFREIGQRASKVRAGGDAHE
ncbi:hypothetical protein ACFL0Q_07660, partial [Thermodesulfobacteriota bacterium]